MHEIFQEFREAHDWGYLTAETVLIGYIEMCHAVECVPTPGDFRDYLNRTVSEMQES